MLLKSPDQLYPNAAGDWVRYEELTDQERQSLLKQFGYADLLSQVVDMVQARSLFGRMLFDELGRLAEDDPRLAEQLLAATPKPARGRPERWTLRARRQFLCEYYAEWAMHKGPRDDLLDAMAERHQLDTTQAVEDLISSSRKRLKNERTLELLRTVCETARSDGSLKDVD